MAKKKSVDPNRNKKERMATDSAYKRKINLRERMRKIWQRQCPLRLAIENIPRRARYAERFKEDPDFRENENRRNKEWYANLSLEKKSELLQKKNARQKKRYADSKAKKLEKKTGYGLDLSKDSMP